jgi:Ankyrin repeats (3 copies)
MIGIREVREDSKNTPVFGKEKPKQCVPRDAEGCRGGRTVASPDKKIKKKKREKNSWRNGGFGAVNPKLARGFLKTIQLNKSSGKQVKIKEIPFFRERAKQWVAVDEKSLTLMPVVSCPTAVIKHLRAPCAAEPKSYEIDRGKRIEFAPLKAKKESGVWVLPLFGIAPELTTVASHSHFRLPLIYSSVTKPVESFSTEAHPVSYPSECSTLPPLIAAVLQRDYQRLEWLLKDPTVNVNAQDADGRTALHHAVIQKDLVIALSLLARSADPNVRDKLSGNTALIEAINSNILELVQLFTEYSKTDVNFPDQEGNPPLVLAKRPGINKAIVKQLMDHPKILLGVLNQCSSVDEKCQSSLLKQRMSVLHSEERESINHKSSDLCYSFDDNHTIVR